ncbi:hypothetical protein O1D97_11235 [Marinomonas sp. 15G1-11]|uniref:DoxX family protein n=1 Tax=Marinomonas phaeophyticola TaxID=3004091 RepID=A0ABT4JV17_9GAMM|nr:hypothetical protein [Marinomonas sp. 15G1-11]MCZ2722194.1 hypothetical protein [Marinomonas sp. 15G1-11]
MLKQHINLKNILTAFIIFVFVQSLFFKFTDSFETQYIFGILGEWSGLNWFGVYGGYLVGISELIVSLILVTRYNPLGALMAVGVMTGAIFFHLATPLGIIQPAFNESGDIIGNDSGTLFVMACFVWLSAVILTVKDMQSESSVLRLLVSKVM